MQQMSWKQPEVQSKHIILCLTRYDGLEVCIRVGRLVGRNDGFLVLGLGLGLALGVAVIARGVGRRVGFLLGLRVEGDHVGKSVASVGA